MLRLSKSLISISVQYLFVGLALPCHQILTQVYGFIQEDFQTKLGFTDFRITVDIRNNTSTGTNSEFNNNFLSSPQFQIHNDIASPSGSSLLQIGEQFDSESPLSQDHHTNFHTSFTPSRHLQIPLEEANRRAKISYPT